MVPSPFYRLERVALDHTTSEIAARAAAANGRSITAPGSGPASWRPTSGKRHYVLAGRRSRNYSMGLSNATNFIVIPRPHG